MSYRKTPETQSKKFPPCVFSGLDAHSKELYLCYLLDFQGLIF